MSSSIKCDCGKLSNSMNIHNWNKHINSCKIRISKRTISDIKSFFTGVEKKKIKLEQRTTEEHGK